MEKNDTIPDLKKLEVGDLLTIENYESGVAKALVYQNEDGIGAIVENGLDLGDMRGVTKGWSIKKVHRNTGMTYTFINHDLLKADFEAGYFEPYFEIL